MNIFKRRKRTKQVSFKTYAEYYTLLDPLAKKRGFATTTELLNGLLSDALVKEWTLEELETLVNILLPKEETHEE